LIAKLLLAPYGSFWNLKQNKFLGFVEINDVSGVQPIDNDGNFIASANTGELYKINVNTLTSSLKKGSASTLVELPL